MAKKSQLRRTASSKAKSSFLANEVQSDRSALLVPISIIKAESNIRRDLANIEEIADSIKEHGVLQPLLVRKGWDLISGHRRLAGARKAGLEVVPVRIADMNENTAALATVVENIQRENLSGIDEIEAVAGLLPIFEGNKAVLAKSLGKSRTYVSQCCRAYEAVKDLDRSTSNGLSKSLLFELGNSKQPENLLERIKKGETATVRDARGHKDREKPPPKPGGRYGAEGFMQYRERKTGFSLRLNIDMERTPRGSINKAIGQLESILNKLKQIT